MTTLIDARNRGRDKSADNRARFLRRFRGLLRTKVADLARQRSIRDGVEGAEVELSPHDISEPRFTHKSGSGHDARVLPGNDRFTRGQTIPRNPHEGAEGSGTGAPGEGQAEDAFRFVLSRDEYLSILFDDLELPKLLRMQRADITETRIRRAGYTRQGVPGTLAVSRTMKTSLSRRIALTGALRQQLAQYHAALAALVLAPEASPDDAGVFESARAQVQILEALIADVESRLQRVPFLDELDLRFRAAVPVKLPRTAAVMLCLMDVSSSMDKT